MLLTMLVLSLVSAALLYASKVPVVQSEWATLIGREIKQDADPTKGQTWHLVFIIFTLTSPLFLAGILSLFVSVMRFQRRRRPVVEREYVD